MPNSDLLRKYFSAYENKDRKAVESLLTDDFSIYQSITTIALTVKPISNGAGRTPRNPQPMALRSCLKKATRPSSSATAKPRMGATPGTRNSSLSKETR